MSYKNSLPFFNALLKTPKGSRVRLLQSFPKFVIDDLNEIIMNVVRGNVDLNKAKKQTLQRHKKSLLSLVNTKNKRLMRHVIYKTEGISNQPAA